jgi:hypothetical protein
MALATARDSNVNFTPFWGNKIVGYSEAKRLLKRSSALGGGVDGRFYAAKGRYTREPHRCISLSGASYRSRSRADLNSRRRRSLPRGDGPPRRRLVQSTRHLPKAHSLPKQPLFCPIRNLLTLAYPNATAKDFLSTATNFHNAWADGDFEANCLE